MNRIECFWLTPTGDRVAWCVSLDAGGTAHGSTTLYRAADGRVFHLGHRPIVADDGRTIEPAPAGAMWDADWLRELDGHQPGPDGRHLVVRTPGGDWIVDGSDFTPRWSRTGEPPRITASPSIRFPGKYHGHLRDGWLESSD